MWTTSASQMIARLTSSTLFSNQNLLSVLTHDHRTASTSTNDPSSANPPGKQVDIATKMRGLRARSPYALFVKDNYAGISAKNPDLKLIQISKIMAESWKNLAADKKQTYSKQSQDQQEHYEQEKNRLSPADLQTVDANIKARRIQHQVKRSIQQLPTKRPRSAYAHFLTTLDRGEADIKEFMQGAAKRWTQMAEQDKQRFEDLHQEEKNRYVKELVTWAANKEQAAAAAAPKKRQTSPSVTAKSEEKPKKTRAKSATSKRSVTKSTNTAKKRTVSAAKANKDEEVSSSDDEATRKPRKTSRSPSAGRKKSAD